MKPQKIQTIKELDPIYDQMQLQYGAKELHAITNGGCIDNPRVCFVFMNPTGKNVASLSDWKGIHSPWIGTKNVWKLFYRLGMMEERIYTKIQSLKANQWDEKFAEEVYQDVKDKRMYLTNLGKCTQMDARPLSNRGVSTIFRFIISRDWINSSRKDCDFWQSSK